MIFRKNLKLNKKMGAFFNTKIVLLVDKILEGLLQTS